MKQPPNPYVRPAGAIVLLLAAGVAIAAVTTALTARAASPGLKAVSCAAPRQVITITITDNAFTPNLVQAHVCDRLIFKNASLRPIEIAFGPHPRHIEYPGLSGRLLAPGASLPLNLTVAGSFPMHDHFRDVIKGNLIVNP